MARKKTPKRDAEEFGLHESEATLQPITETIEKNYMPYVMSVIISRAIPEIDGFKPAHRKLLYNMYKMGLMSGPRTKSTNVVGATMRLNPHGDASIYDTMVRLTRGNEALLHPFIDSKGSFGKQYSSEMAYAQSRYTEVKLDPFCAELFRGIDMNAVDMVDNFDNTMKEPVLFPTSFPNVLVTPNMGIAVGMASKICSFNLAEICDGTIQLLKSPHTTVDQLMDIIKAPDFSGGGELIYNREQLREIYTTGKGSVRLRSKYRYDPDENCIEVYQIPYSTSIELIMKRLTDLVKEGKLKEITDFRDEIDLSGFKFTIDLRRGTDPDKLMKKLFKLTPLEDSFDCNFNVLIGNTPYQLGVCDILKEWIKFRLTCVKRELNFELERKKEKLHLLLALGKLLLDIDKAIRIIRGTQNERDVVPNLMDAFEIDKEQAEYIADIKLRNLNREYLINRTKEIEDLQAAIAELEGTINSEAKLKTHISKQLTEIKKKYGRDRKTEIVAADEVEVYNESEDIENYQVRAVLTKEGYFKKITMLSLRGNDEQKVKEGDVIVAEEDAENTDEILFFSDKGQVYKAKMSDFEPVKASVMGEYIPAKLGFEAGEKMLTMKCLHEYKPEHNMVFFFENGKGVRIPISAYETKGNRKKLVGAYSTKSQAVAGFYEAEPFDVMMIANNMKALVISTALIPIKTTRSSQGVSLYNLRKNQLIESVIRDFESKYGNIKKYRKTKVPATGQSIDELDPEKQQITLGDI